MNRGNPFHRRPCGSEEIMKAVELKLERRCQQPDFVNMHVLLTRRWIISTAILDLRLVSFDVLNCSVKDYFYGNGFVPLYAWLGEGLGFCSLALCCN